LFVASNARESKPGNHDDSPHHDDLVLTRPSHVVVRAQRLPEYVRAQPLLGQLFAAVPVPRHAIVGRGAVVLRDVVLEGCIAVDGEVGVGVDGHERGRGDGGVRKGSEVSFAQRCEDRVLGDGREGPNDGSIQRRGNETDRGFEWTSGRGLT
jgi:hypothetical protein